MKLVINSSPLIFLSKLEYLNQFIAYNYTFYIPGNVANEIGAKSDFASLAVKDLINSEIVSVRTSNLTTLANSLSQRLGVGESEAIALSVELNADYILLDDFAARKEARRLGLNVKGTLAVIKKLRQDGKINFESIDDLYQKLLEIDFRVKRSLFEQIFFE